MFVGSLWRIPEKSFADSRLDVPICLRHPVITEFATASDNKRQVIMDDKIFASARMTAALDDDHAAYEAIPSVNIFDNGPDFTRPTNAIVQGVSRPRRRLGRWLLLVPLLAAAGFLLMACQGGGY